MYLIIILLIFIYFFYQINKIFTKFNTIPVWTGTNNRVAGGENASEKIVTICLI